MRKMIVAILVVALGAMTFVACNKQEDKKSKSSKLRVGVTISPLKDFAEAVGGDKVDVFSIIPDGTEPHDFDPKPRDIEKVMESDIFVYNGLGMEDFIDSLLDSMKEKSVLVVNSSEGAQTIKTDGKTDPHIWLSLKEATRQAENIKNALVEKDSANSQYYNDNYNKLKESFDNLYNEYRSKFTDLRIKDFVTGHAAFGYLCRDFGLSQKSIEDLYGEGEPTPKQFEALVNYCKENKVNTIFSEAQASPENSETLARDANAKVEKIYSLETKEDGKNYIEGMKYDLDKILDSLK